MIKEFIKYYKPYKKLFMLDMLAAFTEIGRAHV